MEVLQRTANRGSISTDTGYNIDNSLKLDSANSEYLYIHRDATGSDWNRLLWTASMWVKHTPRESSATAPKERMFGAADAQSDFDIRFRGQPIGFRNNSDEDGVAELRTTAVYRDYSAWYHVVAVWDTANSTAGNRMRLYVNGEEVTDFSTDTQPSQNEKSTWGKKNDGTDGNVAHTIGAYYNASSGFAQGFNGYMAEVHWVEGQALAPSDFGEFDDDTGIWIPIEYTGSYGTNGFYLDFSNSSSLGADASGNSNNWSLNNIAAADQTTDTPTNNFAIGNILTGTGGYFVITEGATKAVLSTAGPGNNIGGVSLMSTLAPSSGKWYFEAQNTNSGDAYLFLGVADTASIGYTDGYVLGGQSGTLPSIAWRGGGAYDGSAKVYTNNAATGDSVNWETEVVGVALDLDNSKIYFHLSGTYINSGDPANGTDNGGQYDLPTAVDNQWLLGVSGYNLATWLLNFGGYTTMSISSAASDANGYGTFEYAPPTGYYALCTKNLAEYG